MAKRALEIVSALTAFIILMVVLIASTALIIVLVYFLQKSMFHLSFSQTSSALALFCILISVAEHIWHREKTPKKVSPSA